MEYDVVGERDVHAVTQILAQAFSDDPVWGWAFPTSPQQEVWWRFWVGAAIAQGCVRVVRNQTDGDLAAAAVWIPPGGSECAPEDEAHVEPLLRALIGDRTPLLLETLHRFEANHPTNVPHFYLSLLGTATAERGRGLGMALLGHSLEVIDEQHAPAYLESSNPANLHRYESVGFEPIGAFSLPEGEVVITTMWRDPR